MTMLKIEVSDFITLPPGNYYINGQFWVVDDDLKADTKDHEAARELSDKLARMLKQARSWLNAFPPDGHEDSIKADIANYDDVLAAYKAARGNDDR